MTDAAAAHARPTLADVAARAGVSASTASLAFSGSGPVSEATRERVFAAAKALDYAGPDPRAQSLRRGRSGIVGVVLEERVRAAFLDPVKIQVLDGISEGIVPLGAGLLLLTDTGEGAVSVANAPVDAVALIGCSPRLAHTVAQLRLRGIPMVAIEGHAGDDIIEISIDNEDATRRGAEHLRELGHSRVALVTLPLDPERTRGPLTPEREDESTSATTSERIAGARIVFPGIGGVTAGASDVEEGRLAGLALLADPETRPTAVIAQSDLLAAGVIRAAEELGLAVPADVSVLGFDGVRVDGLAPYDLTTLVQPSAAKGRAAGEALVQMLAGEHPEGTCFSSVFHRGNTTAPPAR
ncbi:LacI family DNA-binding transcriptional regulator [Microterricola pindariensis]|uniref:Transcriptional regulator n=1 Tax=Microterricola pindariensis TaxID=478010 RepID=A0ABX5AY05_9MICO|nr:LacI family DNA-binding transcriptional regulator [Microterricola pindariensis]PPL19770.1 transcriptional regulator [Microterricola pindariensis]